MIYLQGKPKYSEKTCPVPLCPPQIPHGLTRARTRASAVRGQRDIAVNYIIIILIKSAVGTRI
jgi:hypothetical protein